MTTISIPLSQGQSTIIDQMDFDLVRGHKWCAHRMGRSFYAVTNVKRPDGVYRLLYMHTSIVKPPKGMVVDHLDGDGLNNRRSNLRYCTRGENAGRQKPQVGRSSRFKGVSWLKSRGKWQTYITKDGRRHSLGYFLEEERAALAYNNAARRLFGTLAVLNPV